MATRDPPAEPPESTTTCDTVLARRPIGTAPPPGTGTGFASLLLGTPTYLSNQYNRGYFYFRQKEIGAYVQDSWKVTRRLSLDVGIRWDKWTVYHEKYNRLLNLDLRNYIGKMEVIT